MRPPSLPADHGSHPDSQIEWWYVTGRVEDENRHAYSVFATVWSSPLGIARLRVVDLRTQQVVISETRVATVTHLDGSALHMALADHALQWRQLDDQGEFILLARLDTGDVRIIITPTRGYTLHGNDGVIAQGDGGLSAYYSATRARVQVSWSSSGQPVECAGDGWMDHQWGDFATTPTALRWDWFGCNFANGTDLMVYRFLNLENRPQQDRLIGTFVDAAGRVRPLGPHDINVTEVPPLLPRPDLGATFATRWRLEVPSEQLEVELYALPGENFIDMGPPGIIFEAHAGVVGDRTSVCFVESSRLMGST